LHISWFPRFAGPRRSPIRNIILHIPQTGIEKQLQMVTEGDFLRRHAPLRVEKLYCKNGDRRKNSLNSHTPNACTGCMTVFLVATSREDSSGLYTVDLPPSHKLKVVLDADDLEIRVRLDTATAVDICLHSNDTEGVEHGEAKTPEQRNRCGGGICRGAWLADREAERTLLGATPVSAARPGWVSDFGVFNTAESAKPCQAPVAGHRALYACASGDRR